MFEDGGSMFLQNVGIYLQVHSASLPSRSTPVSSTPWEPQISYKWLFACVSPQRLKQSMSIQSNLRTVHAGLGGASGITVGFSPRNSVFLCLSQLNQCSLLFWHPHHQKLVQRSIRNRSAKGLCLIPLLSLALALEQEGSTAIIQKTLNGHGNETVHSTSQPTYDQLQWFPPTAFSIFQVAYPPKFYIYFLYLQTYMFRPS
jgi:hypothetical protein